MDFTALFTKARSSFERCIRANSDLVSEINMPLDSLIPEDEWIKFQFLNVEDKHFDVEARLALFAPNGDRIDYYCYHESDTGEFVDEFLVFD